MFLWQLAGDSGQNQTSGGLMDGYPRYHHRHSTTTINLMVIGASEYDAIDDVIRSGNVVFGEALSV